jgi:hypothetical protein
MVIRVSALTMIFAWSADASATPRQLDCVLTDTETKPASESRPIVIIFDEDKKTLTAEEAGHSYSFSEVSISNVSVTAEADSISLGIDRSSFGIVWQQYGADKVVTEFGHCRPVTPPT